MDSRTPASDQIADPGPATPMMAQYIEIKTANPDCLLFYRMGDFYELFFDDAEVASRALGITLTKRGKHLGADIPMCGVPIHAADQYLQKLIALGHRVAVCEQTENPADARKRGAKAVVRRDVIRLVTPGTLTEDALLSAGRNNYLAAVSRQRGGHGTPDDYGLAWVDISTGEFRVAASDRARLAADLSRIAPSEAIVSDALFADPDLAPLWRDAGAAVTPLAAAFFDGATASQRLAAYFGVASLDGFGSFTRAEVAAAAAALAYVEKTQIRERPPLSPPVKEAAGDVMLIDAATRANLELTATLNGARDGSLIAAIDRTVTGAGARQLARRLSGPLTDPALIGQRLDSVAWMLADAERRRRIRDGLAAAPDLARALSRLALDRGGPRDLAAVGEGLAAASSLVAEVEAGAPLPAEMVEVHAALAAAPADLFAHLRAALANGLPHLRRDGNFVRDGYRADLDEARSLRDESRRVIASLQATYAAETEIRNLRIKHNNVLGYFIEVGAGAADRLFAAPLNARFIHRQTLASAIRFTTTELADLEARIAGAGERALAIELEVFAALVAEVAAAAGAVRAIADALATLDVAAALAALADTEGYCRPVVEDSLAFAVADGRHPVVEQALRKQSAAAFVANDADLGGDDAGSIWLVTGPNMAGKSTFLRQNALIAILAQTGSYVPAKSARIGIVDRLFSRVGAADDLARGRSTFMVEMVETAAILNQAGARSLVVLDEIGRGTATFDGLSIAWAAIEHLHEVNRSRALFATHYHELTALADRLPRLRNVTVRVKEWQGDVIFLHEIAPGAADRSYGIQVARLAGLPPTVVARARQVLRQLEETDRKSPAHTLIDDLPLFSAARTPATEALVDPVAALLDGIAPDELSPKEALEELYKLKAARRRTNHDEVAMTGSENGSKFLWGAASSAFQVEGHPHAGGRGRSKWDVYTHEYRITEAVVGVQHDADVAINAYDRAQSLADIAIMRDAGLAAYRFSISWPRIFPEGTGAANQPGIDHYSRFVDDLLAAGIKPLATLYHWDFPWALHQQGGWHNRDVAGWFSDYASTVFSALGDRVDTFVTINEPQIDLFMMDLIAAKVHDGAADPWAWSSADIAGQAPAMHNLLRANAAAVAAYRSLGLAGMIGIALPLYPTIPLNPKRAEDVAAARLVDGLMNRWPLDAVFLGSYPDDVIAALQKHNPSFAPSAADLAAIAAAPVDFLGVNYYSPAIVEADDRFPLGLRWGNAETNPDPVKAFNGPVRPDELRKLLLRIRDDYGNPPTFVTENGAGFGDFDEVMEEGAVKDPFRTDYILRHAAATVAARDEGADVRGYMCWSLFDNFEWIQGYTRRFGMVHVDFATQKRTPKQSFRVYRDMIARTGVG